MGCVKDIPDPADAHYPARYAVLAALVHLLCDSFNWRIKVGLPRDAPPIIEDWEEIARRPKIYEEVPAWAMHVEPLPEVLRIPDLNGNYVDADHKRASSRFKQMNILIFDPPIHFT